MQNTQTILSFLSSSKIASPFVFNTQKDQLIRTIDPAGGWQRSAS